MRQNEITVGQDYIAKVGIRETKVRIETEHEGGGWTATVLKSGASLRIKDPKRLRALNVPHEETPVATEATAAEATVEATTTPTDDLLDSLPPSGPDKAASDAPANEAEPAANATPVATPATPKKRGRTQGKMGGLDAAVLVLAEAGRPMTAGQITTAAIEAGHWNPQGKTPSATLYSAIHREIKLKADEARFRKVERGMFELTDSSD